MGDLIHTDKLGKRYARHWAVSDLSLSLDAGSPIALVGPNGAGKTTFISLLAAFIRPSSGSVRVLGEAPGSRALFNRLGVMPQDADFDPALSILRQLGFYAELQLGSSRREAETEAMRVLEAVSLREAAGLKARELSHGMRKRVQLAQSLIGSPELVLLDEPTAGIDPPNARAIRTLIGELADRVSFMISSHNLDELERLCDRVVYLEAGRLVYAGSVSAAPSIAGGGADGVEGDGENWLSIRIVGVDAETFAQAASALPGVIEVRQRPQGEFLLRSNTGVRLEPALLGLLADRGWDYRQLKRGLSLEERLYGE